MGTRRRFTALVLAIVTSGGLLAACVPDVVRPRMSPSDGAFFTTPWPNDVRRRPDGSIDLANFPGRWNGVVNTILQRGERDTFGFGANAAAYFTFDGSIATSSLPDPAASVTDTSPVMLVNLDPDSPDRLERTPARVEFRSQASLYRPANLLSILPYPGFPLDEDTTYAVILFTGLRDGRGRDVAPARFLSTLEGPWTPESGYPEDEFAALAAQWGVVKDYVSAHTSWDVGDVAGFTNYTTGSYLAPMTAIDTSLAELAQPDFLDASVVKPCTTGNPNHVTVDGYVDVPRWQSGTSPYLDSGGGVVVSDGRAVQQGSERVRARIAFPCQAPPAGGWPVVVTINGTGADYTSATTGFVDRYYPEGTELHHAVISIAPYFSGDREDPELAAVADRLASLGVTVADLDLASVAYFNFFNPVAGRDNQLQQASEILFLERVAQGFQMSGAAAGTASDLTTDDAAVSFFGHSQGAGPAPMALAVDPGIDAALLSGAAAGLYHALVHRGDIRPLVDTLLAATPSELYEAHPLMSALQTLTEGGDAANFAAAVRTRTVLMPSGIEDGCSTFEGAEHLATAMGLDVAAPPIRAVYGIETLLGRPPLAPPFGGNLGDGRTGLMVQLDAGHFGVRANPAKVRSFFDSVAAGGAAIPTGAWEPETNPTTCLRHD